MAKRIQSKTLFIKQIPLTAQMCVVNNVKKIGRKTFTGFVKCDKFENDNILFTPIYKGM